jgi:Tol biopolymer transport system component
VAEKIAYYDFAPDPGRSGGGWLVTHDGNQLAAQRWNGKTLALEGERKPIGQPFRVNRPLSASANALTFVRAADGYALTFHDRSGKVGARVGDISLTAHNHPEVSPDGSKVSWDSGRLDVFHDIWVAEPGRGIVSRINDPPTDTIISVWHGNKLLYIRSDAKGATSRIIRRNADGSGPEEEIPSNDSGKHHFDVSSDGHWLVYMYGEYTGSNIAALELVPGAKPVPILTSPASEIDPRLSPDGRWLAYGSDETGRAEIFIQSFPPGKGKWQISSGGGIMPKWRADGKELVYVANSRAFYSVAIRPGPQGLEVGKPTELFSSIFVHLGHYGLTADAQQLLFDEVAGRPQEVTVWIGWREMLK